jgi:hypothetical protein
MKRRPAGADGSKDTVRLRRTPEEQEIIDHVARVKGRDWAERYSHLILEQARAIGDLADE